MYKILKAEQLTANIFLMDVEAPRVARHCEPGQFVIVKMDEKGERIHSQSVTMTEKPERSPSYSSRSEHPQPR